MRAGHYAAGLALGALLVLSACAEPAYRRPKPVDINVFLYESETVNLDRLDNLRRAAAAGDPAAEHALGVAYAEAAGVAPDLDEAIRLWRSAAAKGNADAQNALAFAFAEGRGVPRDPAEAERLWRAAAMQGHAVAQYNLGGQLVVAARDRSELLEGATWLRRAADQDDPEAQFFLGNLLYTGEGVPEDRAEARRLWRAAAGRGHEEARAALEDPEAHGASPSKSAAVAVVEDIDAMPLPAQVVRASPTKKSVRAAKGKSRVKSGGRSTRAVTVASSRRPTKAKPTGAAQRTATKAPVIAARSASRPVKAAVKPSAPKKRPK